MTDQAAQDLINVLDHGFVRLVDHMGSDLNVVRAARVSYDAAWRAGEDEGSDARLINYLWKNKHTTPFEAVTLTFEVKAPIFVFRQWHRHRTASYNELSARYRELPEEYYLPSPALVGQQAKVNKQGRDVTPLTPEELRERKTEVALLEESIKNSFVAYKHLLSRGWPRELARGILPVFTYSHMFVTLNLRNLFHFFDLRRDGHAQYEIRVYADAMFELTKKLYPVCCGAWERSFEQEQQRKGANQQSKG